MSDDLKYFKEAQSSVYRGGSFDQNTILIVRFLVRNFFKKLPTTGAATFVRKAVACLSDDLDKYDVLGLTIHKAKPLQSLQIEKRVSQPSVMTDDGSWIVDLVVRSATDEKAWTNPEVWNKHLVNALEGWAGFAPTVDVMGMVGLPLGFWDRISISNETIAHFKHVEAIWRRRRPVYLVQACSLEQQTNPDFKDPCPTVKNTPFNATGAYNKGLVGDDGLGFARGLADHPDWLEPINIKDKGWTPSIWTPGGGGPADDTEKKKPSKTNDYIAFAAFAALGYVAYQKVLKDLL
jgi:hypothetical protein